VERVVYPGLESYTWRERALYYLEPVDGVRYFGGMISFYLKNADFNRTMRFLYYLNNHTHIQHKASLGGPIDSVESPLALSHAACDAEHNFRCGITNNNVRLSVGRVVSADFTISALNVALYAIKATII
jgi:cystathionine beta-lyase/cystathionine gamma-synthase